MKSLTLQAEGDHFISSERRGANLVFTSDSKTGYSPIEMTVLSSGACAAFVYRSILENSKVEAQIEKLELHYEQVDTRPKRIRSIEMLFHVHAKDDHAQARAESCLKFVHRYCPVIQSLSEEITITDQLIFEV